MSPAMISRRRISALQSFYVAYRDPSSIGTGCRRKLMCRFSDAGTHDANHALRRPASEKRQGTKLRWVGHGGCRKRYGELAAALVWRRSGGSGRRDRFGSEDGGRCWYKPMDRTVRDQIGGASAGQSDRPARSWALPAVIRHE